MRPAPTLEVGLRFDPVAQDFLSLPQDVSETIIALINNQPVSIYWKKSQICCKAMLKLNRCFCFIGDEFYELVVSNTTVTYEYYI